MTVPYFWKHEMDNPISKGNNGDTRSGKYLEDANRAACLILAKTDKDC